MFIWLGWYYIPILYQRFKPMKSIFALAFATTILFIGIDNAIDSARGNLGSLYAVSSERATVDTPETTD